MPPSCEVFIASAPRASVATSSSEAPPLAAAAAATAPSTSGASLSRIFPGASPSSSTANSALISALPRSIRTRTPSGDIARSIAARTRSASVPSTPGSSVPPAASRARSAPAISRARLTTPWASASLCETTTIPTTSEPVGAVQVVDRMDRLVSGGVRDLPAAGLAVARDLAGARRLDLAEQVRPDRLRDVVFLGLQSVRPGDPAAPGVPLGDLEAGDQREQLERGLADPVALLLAGRVVEDVLVDRL